MVINHIATMERVFILITTEKDTFIFEEILTLQPTVVIMDQILSIKISF